ncbi:GTP cyclohydrolase IIa [Haloarchaeobius sp. HRN-SO-5]|uniref:GTP cyclohydrolase IIa n=1 Tax=Haloarchaeobius sp. HRN-SO-5 TaxID=3446118 RepID=UPI003EB7D67A
MMQATLFQLDDYGPWTTTPAPRAEMDLQTLQSRVYADVASFVGSRDGYAFYARGDNLLAFTSGIDRGAHETLQSTIRNRYPVTLSAGIGTGSTPRSAVEDATDRLQAAGSAQDSTRTEACRGTALAAADPFHVAHFDVVDATATYTDETGAYDSFLAMTSTFEAVSRTLYEHHGLAFFVGGDNVLALCPLLAESTYDGVIDEARARAGVDLRVGVGQGVTPATAGMDAKRALEVGRESDRATVFADGATAPPADAAD